tara:strand:+ start:1928 stop:2209 length:282 start_codon:yes stop_codon:yes gene_type:complete
MSRYDNTKIKRYNSILRYRSTIYQKVPESNDDMYVITQVGDRLDSLANEYYGSSNLWWFIAHVNNLNSMNIEPGTRLRISFDLDKAKDVLDKS